MAEGDLIYAIPQNILDQIPFLIRILEAVGVLIIVYILFWIIKLYLDKKKKEELERINQSLEEIKILLNKNKS